MLLQILLIAAIIGAALAYFFGGGTKKDVARGAAGGVLVTLGLLLQLLLFGVLSLVGIWLVRHLF